ncbi:Glyco-tran-10-N domain-containing protein [Aphelenchoides besseyi]|nr:Glyco-tran-10-N domain-containing protein [Aphelenchoides besseyi]
MPLCGTYTHPSECLSMAGSYLESLLYWRFTSSPSDDQLLSNWYPKNVKHKMCRRNTSYLIEQMQNTQRQLSSHIQEHFTSLDKRFKVMNPLFDTAMAGFRYILQPFELMNKDEAKYFLEFSDPQASCNYITLGVGHDWEAEKKMQKKYPQCQFFWALIQLKKIESSAFIEFLATENKGELVDFMTMDIEGPEFLLLKEMHHKRPELPIICQLNAEVHYNHHMVRFPWEQISNTFKLFFEESRYVLLKTNERFEEDRIFSRMFFVNVVDEECIRNFLLFVKFEPSLNNDTDNTSKLPVILLWNEAFAPNASLFYNIQPECPYSCLITTNRSYGDEADIRIMDTEYKESEWPPNNPKAYNARWLFESPRDGTETADEIWTPEQIKNLVAKKTKGVLAIMTNCHIVNSGRFEYVEELSKHINITKIGSCYGNRKSSEELKKLLDDHYFVLAFENSICPEYTTEKYWRFSDLVVPVLMSRGILNWHNVINGTFIVASDFESPSTLAEHLNSLIDDKSAYMEYFEWTKSYRKTLLGNRWPAALRSNAGCQLCRIATLKPPLPPINMQEYWSAKECASDFGFHLINDTKTVKTMETQMAEVLNRHKLISLAESMPHLLKRILSQSNSDQRCCFLKSFVRMKQKLLIGIFILFLLTATSLTFYRLINLNAAFSRLSQTTKSNQCSEVPLPILPPEMFGEAVKFEMKFANFNLTYEMKQPKIEVCNNISFLVLVISRPDGFYAREMIRRTWMNDINKPSDYRVLFIVGHSGDPAINRLLDEEQRQFGDVIRYSAEDTYERLYVKVHAAFSWQQKFCPQARYLLKTDDDTAVDLGRMNYFVQTEFNPLLKEHPKAFICNRWAGKRPLRDPHNPYVSTSEYNGTVYPTFCQGCSYLTTTDAIGTLLNNTINVTKQYIWKMCFSQDLWLKRARKFIITVLRHLERRK